MKDEILQTALMHFLKHGIREMSIQKIVEPLGISTKTVYKYFKNKEELLEAACYLYYEQQYQILENLPKDQSAGSLFFDLWYKAVETEYKINRAFFQDLHYYYPELAGKIESFVAKKFVNQITGIVKQGIREGAFSADINPEMIVESIFVFYNAIVREDLYKRFQAPLVDVLINTIAVYIKGFCTKQGAEDLEKHILSNYKNPRTKIQRIIEKSFLN